MGKVLVCFLFIFACSRLLAAVRYDGDVGPSNNFGVEMHAHTPLSSVKPGAPVAGPDHFLAPQIEDLGARAKAHKVAIFQLDHGALMSSIRWAKSAKCQEEWEKEDAFTFRGFEWTKGMIWDKDACHIGVVNTDWFCDPQSLGDRQKELEKFRKKYPNSKLESNPGPDIVPDIPALYTWLDKNLGKEGFWGIPHPWAIKKFNDFPTPDQQLVLKRCYYIEIAGGPSAVRIKDGLQYGCQAVQKGLPTGFGFGSDNLGNIKYIESSTYGGAILDSPGQTRRNILKAIRGRRLFVSEEVGFWYDWRLESKSDQFVAMGGIYDIKKLGPVKMYRYYIPTAKRHLAKTMFLWLVYPDRVEKFYPNNNNGYMKPVERINLDHPMAVICGMITYQDRWICGSPIWME